MYIRKWSPVFSPEVEAGTAQTNEGGAPLVEQTEQISDGPGSGRSDIRKELEKNFEADRKATEQTDQQRDKQDKGRKSAKGYQRRDDLEEGKSREGTQEQEAKTEQPVEGAEGEAGKEQQIEAAPEGWTKEAKAEWERVSPAVRTAVLKREVDMAKGVEELKKRQGDIDEVLKPRMDMIRHHGHTPAQAVNQLFAWFEALNADRQRLDKNEAAVAFPALAKSFGIDLNRVFQQMGLQQQGQEQKGQQQEQQKKDGQPDLSAVPDAVKAYIGGLEKNVAELGQKVDARFGQFEQTFAQQEQGRTQAVLQNWAKDKPHFNEVRQMMAHLLVSGAVPARQDGQADLDKAYDMALYAVPEVRAQVLKEAQDKQDAERKKVADAERKAQQDQVSKARRATGSLGPSAPGADIQDGKKQKRGKTVRESINAALEEVRGS